MKAELLEHPLGAWLRDRANLLKIAEEMGVSESTLYKWASRRSVPSKRMQKALAMASRGAVPEESWAK